MIINAQVHIQMISIYTEFWHIKSIRFDTSLLHGPRSRFQIQKIVPGP